MEIHYEEDNSFEQVSYKNLEITTQPDQHTKMVGYNRFKARYSQHKKMAQLKQKKKSELKDLVLKAKVNLLIKNFIRKIQRGRVNTEVPLNIKFEDDSQRGNLLNRIFVFLSTTDGIELSPIMLTIWSFINIIQITAMVIIYSITITFPETQKQGYFVAARIFSVILYFIDMILNFTTVRHEIGGWKKNLNDIIIFYLKNQFIPDFFSIAFFPLSNIFEASEVTSVLMVIALFKLKNNMKRFQSYQYIYIKSNSREQYYSLIKVFLLNFSIGHILSILLNLMATVSSTTTDNWHSKLGILEDSWHVKYIWGYYWGTNIMLTVGFGDLVATNLTEAGLLIFIETLSCITLAYNISCVGSIIGQINAENEQKKTKLKYFHRMCEENNISEQLSQKINNFIEQSYLLKQQFQLQKYEDVINSLPKSMQSEYRKQANQSLFDVGFFNSLNNKTILNLAEWVIRKVAHPEQIIQKKGEIEYFCILQKGCLGFTCRYGPKSILNGSVISRFQIMKHQNPKILSLGFIKRKPIIYDIKCLYYSIYYYLTYEQLVKILQTCEMDYQFFHYMKDKDDIILGCNQIYKCKVCLDDYHSPFECPKYHYLPLKELVIASYLKKQKLSKNIRMNHFHGRYYRDFRVLTYQKIVRQTQQKYMKHNFDSDQISQIVNIKQYYYKKMRHIQQKQPIQKDIFPLVNQSTNHVLKHHFDKLEDILNKVSSSLSSINFWIIESDVAANFGYYFKQFNPNRLNQFKMYSKKKGNKDNTFGGCTTKKSPYNPVANSATVQIFHRLFDQNSQNSLQSILSKQNSAIKQN